MTDNKKFKEEAGELLDRIIQFRRNYLAGKVNEPFMSAPNVLFEAQLRMMLLVARTDQENETQNRIDSQC